jgi:heme/copper-type cytochrome/quinol oxidase subunit 4
MALFKNSHRKISAANRNYIVFVLLYCFTTIAAYWVVRFKFKTEAYVAAILLALVCVIFLIVVYEKYTD